MLSGGWRWSRTWEENTCYKYKLGFSPFIWWGIPRPTLVYYDNIAKRCCAEGWISEWILAGLDFASRLFRENRLQFWLSTMSTRWNQIQMFVLLLFCQESWNVLDTDLQTWPAYFKMKTLAHIQCACVWKYSLSKCLSECFFQQNYMYLYWKENRRGHAAILTGSKMHY